MFICSLILKALNKQIHKTKHTLTKGNTKHPKIKLSVLPFPASFCFFVPYSDPQRITPKPPFNFSTFFSPTLIKIFRKQESKQAVAL